MDKQKYFYIYNLRQARFFMDHGLFTLEVDRGKRGDVYVKFLRDDKAEEVFGKWIERMNNQ